jgi:putative DNA primase/helicase
MTGAVGDTVAELVPDFVAATDFLRAFAPGERWCLVAIEPDPPVGKTARVEAEHFDERTAAEAHAWMRQYGAWNLYYAVNAAAPGCSTTPTKEQITELRCLHVDVDLPKGSAGDSAGLLAQLRALEPPPSAIVFSGGGDQAMWRFPSNLPPAEMARVEAACREISSSVAGGDHCWNCNRLLRLPGTINRLSRLKRSRGRTPALAYVVEADWSRTWSFETDPVPRPAPSANGHDPDGLDGLAARPAAAPLSAKVAKIVNTGDATRWGGDRSRAVFYVACAAVRAGWPHESIAELLLDPKNGISAHVLEQGNPNAYAERQARDARQKVEKAGEEGAELSEQWLALKFVAEHRDRLAYTPAWDRWHHWTGAVWRRDDRLAAFTAASKLCRAVAKVVENPVAAQWLSTARTRAAVVSLAKEQLVVLIEQWNADPWLLGTPGGTVDLRTGALRPATPEDYVSMTTAAAPAGDCPLFKTTIKEICGGDDGLVDFLQRFFGYCLTGLTREEKLLFFLGDGGNGKGTVIETVAHVLGDYAVVVAMTTLIQTRHQEHPTEIAKLFKARLAVASETSDGGRINAARVKLLTGSDELTGRYMRADFFDFAPTHKLVISGNRPLIVGRSDQAIKRRWNTVRFKVIFKEDTTLKERLRAEAGGILAWLIEGCLAWQRDGLKVPKVVTDDTAEYLAAQDDLGLFIAERCETDDPNAKTLASDLYWDWRQWCAVGGVYAGSSREFRDRMEKRFKMTNPKNRPTFEAIKLSGAPLPTGAGGWKPGF